MRTCPCSLLRRAANSILSALRCSRSAATLRFDAQRNPVFASSQREHGQVLRAHVLNVLFNTGLGGVEQAFLDTCVALKAEDIHVTALARPDAAMLPVLKEAGVDMITSRWIGHRWAARVPFLPCWLAGKWKRFGFTHVLAHNARALPLLKRLFGSLPLVAMSHGSDKGFGAATRVLAVNGRLAERLRAALPGMKVDVLPNMIVEVPPLVAHRPNMPPVIGTLARLSARGEKGVDMLLQALGLLAARGVGFKAVIGGDGPDRDALEAEAARLGLAGKLEFVGWVKDRDAFYRQVDVYCLPSHHEAFGLVLLESMAHGVPIAATMCDGPLDILHDGKSALLCPVGDATAMADALERLVADEALRRQLAAAAHADVQQYRMDVVGKKLAAFVAEA
ncbi:glycosyltransferase [bacterium]|nr:glycosyltransferase [bacterium]